MHFCTADIGWITGHSYIVYGPLALGATSLLYEGLPTYPEPDRYWQVVEKHKATTIYTAPTVIRSLIGQGDEWPMKHPMESLRFMASVGEPIDPNSWMWYYEEVGKGRVPLSDTWWQTETGGHMIAPLAGAMPAKSAFRRGVRSSACRPPCSPTRASPPASARTAISSSRLRGPA